MDVEEKLKKWHDELEARQATQRKQQEVRAFHSFSKQNIAHTVANSTVLLLFWAEQNMFLSER